MRENREEALERTKKDIEIIVKKIFSENNNPMDDMTLVYKLSFFVWEYLGNYLSLKGWTAVEEDYGEGIEDTITIRTGSGSRVVSLFEYMSGATDQIFEKILDCIKYYAPDKGDFINYFNRSFQKGNVIAEMDRDQHSSGMTYRDADSYTDSQVELEKAIRREKEDKRIIRKIHAFFNAHPDIDLHIINIEELFSAFSEENNLSIGEVRFRKLFHEYIVGTPVSINQMVKNSEDDSVEIGNFVADRKSDEAFDLAISGGTEDVEGLKVEELFEKINKLYIETGYETESKLVKKVFLTSELAQLIDAGKYYNIVCEKDFFDADTFAKVLGAGKKLKKKEIAEICGCSAANVTKITKSFWEEISNIGR